MARIYLKMDSHIKGKLKMENKDMASIGILMEMYIKVNGLMILNKVKEL